MWGDTMIETQTLYVQWGWLFPTVLCQTRRNWRLKSGCDHKSYTFRRRTWSLTVSRGYLAPLVPKFENFRRDYVIRQSISFQRKEWIRDILQSSTWFASRTPKPMFWKKGTEYRGVVAPLGEITRWEVARANPRVTNSNADTRNHIQRSRSSRKVEQKQPFPMLTTKVPGMGGASIHCPERFWTCSPRCGDACKS